MANRKRTRAQARADRRALKILRSKELITGKIDLRKPPSRRQKALIKKFADVISGKAAVVKPANASDYKKLYDVVGDKVIIPRRKGESIRVDKQGDVIGTRRVRGRRVTSKHIRVGKETRIKRSEHAQYAIPFLQPDGSTTWHRFPNYDELKAFMAEYARYKGWKKYTISEKKAVSEGIDFEDDDELTFILEEKLGRRLMARKPRSLLRRARDTIKRVRTGRKVKRKRKARTSKRKARSRRGKH